MDRDMNKELLNVLDELREGQKQQLEKQTEALEIQRANFELVKEQFERANKLQDRAEKMQESGALLMAKAKKSFVVLIPIILVLLLALGWLILRMF